MQLKSYYRTLWLKELFNVVALFSQCLTAINNSFRLYTFWPKQCTHQVSLHSLSLDTNYKKSKITLENNGFTGINLWMQKLESVQMCVMGDSDIWLLCWYTYFWLTKGGSLCQSTNNFNVGYHTTIWTASKQFLLMTWLADISMLLLYKHKYASQ